MYAVCARERNRQIYLNKFTSNVQRGNNNPRDVPLGARNLKTEDF